MKSALIIQTAFIGDVILATPLIEKMHAVFPGISIDFLVKKGNEGLFHKHPKLHKIYVFDKRVGKIKALFQTIKQVRHTQYDIIINLHRFASSGIIASMAKAKLKVGFNKNPFSFFYDEVIKHKFDTRIHEIDRNLALIQFFTDHTPYKPKLYPTAEDYNYVNQFVINNESYYCFAPSSVWFTKQIPKHKSLELINKLNGKKVFLLGAPSDYKYCEDLINLTGNMQTVNLCGKLNLLQSAALMQNAEMNFVNDSAPLHIASAMNAPVTAIYCSTVPEFGFGPLSDHFKILQVEKLSCKPCGLHGYKSCPKGHFKCGEIDLSSVVCKH